MRARLAREDGTALAWERTGVWCGCKELLAAAELWNLRIVVVRPGHATELVGKGERIVWLKLELRHNEFLASDNSDEFKFKASRRADIKETAENFLSCPQQVGLCER